MPTRFSVVIPTYRRIDDLARCLSALRHAVENRSDESVEIIVTDDSPDNETRNRLSVDFPEARWLEGPRRGPAANRNHGARHARGEWILFLDDDCIPQPEWIAGYADALADNPAVRVLEGRTTAGTPRQSLDEESPVNETGGHFWSCNIALRASLFAELGGFDEDFPHAAMEDVDLRERLKTRGEPIVFIPAAHVVHPWRKTKGRLFQEKRIASWEYLVRKHPHLVWRSPAQHYARLALYSFRKETLPGLFRFRGRGFSRALRRDLSYILLAGQYSTGRRKSPIS